ncbi:MAG: hypothetical protein GY707_00740 [Desulfobacteraceae bacterium]|nr:hypothetical protein [Desulfobacteraceae bacterium]
MKKKQWFLLFLLAITVLFLSTSVLYAGKILIQKKGFTKTPKAPSAKTSKTLKARSNLPDLVVEKASWSKNPKEGDIVGASPILHITVLNKGTAPAGASKLRIDCKSLTSTNYPYPLSGMIHVQPLGPKQSMTYAWPNISTEKWYAGTYKLDFEADHHFNLVNESNENNNTNTLTFTVLSKMDLIKKMKKKPPIKLQLITDLKVVSISMTPSNPVSGEVVTVTAQVKNIGKVETPKVDAIFTFWNTKGGGQFSTASPSVPKLLPGHTFEIKTSATIITLGKSSAVSAKIDRFNKFNEINEKNNEKIHYFNVQCKPELAPYDYTKPKPASVNGNTKPGEEFTTTIWVYNNSGCQSKPASLVIQGGGVPITSYDIPAIKANQKVGIPVSLKWTEPGYKNCEIIVDYTNTNDESIENNNRMELIVSVGGEWPNT